MAYRTFLVHAHLMHLYAHGLREGKQEQTKNGKAAVGPKPGRTWDFHLWDKLSTPRQQHFFIKQHQRLVSNPSTIIPHGEQNGWIRRRRARLWDGCMFRTGLGVGWQLSLTFGNSLRVGWAFSSWSRADYWQHYIIKMSKCSTSLLEHK